MAGEPKEIPENIFPILDKASDYVGRYEAETFGQNMFSYLREGDMQSPIEYAFYIAFHAVMKVNYLYECEPISSDQMSPGIGLWPQYRIGPYKADFLVAYYKYLNDEKIASVFRQVVVECDGTAFHERTEAERRKEKLRDRYMQKLGMKVFRYTGKEILDDPYKVAVDVIGYVTDDEENTYTPEQYFG